MTTACRHSRTRMLHGVPTCVMCGLPVLTGLCPACSKPLDDHDGLVKDEARCPGRRG